jgi:uncharacterized protein YaeQ
MAIGASIYKADLNFSDFTLNSYQDFNLTMAKHPSESEERMMYRLIAFCCFASEDLKFTKGISNQEEPELWQKDLSGDILHWIELGLPDEKRLRQAAGKSKKVSVFTTNPNTWDNYYQKIKNKVPKDKVDIYSIEIIENGPIDKIVERTMKLSCTIEDELMYLGNDDLRIAIKCSKLS